jgi:hypothetical protein
MYKNVASQSLTLSVYDSANGLQKTGDAANLLFYVDKDDAGPNAIASNSGVPTEISSTNSKGDYKIALSQSETNADKLHFTGKSSTTGIVVLSKTIYTLPANFTKLVVDSSGLADANAVKVGPTGGGTTQTARDLGASVLLSSGTGTGQLDFTSGVVKANATQLLGTAWLTPAVAGTPDVNAKQLNGQVAALNANNFLKVSLNDILATTLTETSGQLAGGFKKFFNIATPAATMDHGVLVDTVTTVSNQLTAAAIATGVWQDTTAGDFTTASSIGKSLFTSGNVPGAASGLSIVGSAMTLAASQHVIVDSGTVTTLTNLPAAPTDWLTAAAVKADAVTKIQAGLSTYAGADTAGTTTLLSRVTGAVVLAGSAPSWYVSPVDVSANVGAIKAKTDNLPASPAAVGSAMVLSATGLDAITATDPGGVATTFPAMLVQLWRRFFKRTTLTSTQLKTYADDGTTLRTTQTVSDDTVTQTQGPAS